VTESLGGGRDTHSAHRLNINDHIHPTSNHPRAENSYLDPTQAYRRKRESQGEEVRRGKSRDLKLASPTLQGTDWTQMSVSGSELRT